MIEQGTPEWFARRLGKLTASRMADASMKKETASRRNYLAQLVAERLSGEPGESFTNASMQWGMDNEPLARAEYEILRGIDLEQIAFVDHPTIEWCGASPDGLVDDRGLVEIKCPNTATHIDYMLGQKPPAKHVPQMLLQLACTGRQWCDFISYDPRLPDDYRLFVVRFEPTADELQSTETTALEFLQDVAVTINQLRALTQRNKSNQTGETK
jgi:putative phage-type endonuclease